MKKLSVLLFFIVIVTNAQHKIEGIISPNIKTDWVILYQVLGAKQKFISNTNIQKDSILVGNSMDEVGRFSFTMPKDAIPGSYRATFNLDGAGYVDFVYNNEDVTFAFNPQYPNQSVTFIKSEENKLLSDYTAQISYVQQQLDSLQIEVLKNPSLDYSTEYSETYNRLDSVQNSYLELSKSKYVYPFVKATIRSNSPKIITSTEDYMTKMKNSFFDRMDFSNTTLMNSSFLIDRILDYIFYINYSDDAKTQQALYKSSVDTVLNKVKTEEYKRDIIEYLVAQFEANRNIELIDYLFTKHYNTLPKQLQNEDFKNEKLKMLATEIGRTAPDFSWQENGKTVKLSTLNTAEKYVLVFWSTGCSHCLREIPQLHSYMKGKTDVKVVAFALENDTFVWETYSKANLQGWHNVLGLQKWENKIARTYNINATPTYFILDSNKKIIAKPDEFKDVKAYFEGN